MIRTILKIFSIALLSTFLNLAFAADDLPKIDCVLTDKSAAFDDVEKTDTFNKDTKVIYLVCQSDEVKKGQNIKAVWMADDTNKAAPDNYKIDEKGIMIDKELGDSENWTGNYSLSAPTKGWPAGKYHVDLYVDDALQQAVNFTVK